MTPFIAIDGSTVTFKTRAGLMMHPAFANLRTDGDGNPCVWENHYTDGTHNWSSPWSCQCEEEGIEPHTSDWLPTCTSWHEDGSPNDAAYHLWETLPEAGTIEGLDAEIRGKAERREIATILAALRFWQAAPDGWKAARFMDIATDGGEIKPLTAAEIDRLCEAINSNVEADPSF